MSAIGTKRTSPSALQMSAFGGKADMPFCAAKCLLMTQSGHSLRINTNWLRQSEASTGSSEYSAPRSSKTQYFRKASDAPRSARSSDCLLFASYQRLGSPQPSRESAITNLMHRSIATISTPKTSAISHEHPSEQCPDNLEKMRNGTPKALIETLPLKKGHAPSRLLIQLLDCLHEQDAHLPMSVGASSSKSLD